MGHRGGLTSYIFFLASIPKEFFFSQNKNPKSPSVCLSPYFAGEFN